MMTFTKMRRMTASGDLFLTNDEETSLVLVTSLLKGIRYAYTFTRDAAVYENAVLTQMEFIFIAKKLPGWRFYFSHNPYLNIHHTGNAWCVEISQNKRDTIPSVFVFDDRRFSDFLDHKEDSMFVSEGGQYVHS